MNQRIAHLTSVHPPFDPRIFHKQCKTLRNAGFDVHLVAQHTQSEVVDDIPICALPQMEGRYVRLALQPSLYRQARALQADVYHIHDPELIPLLWLLKHTTDAAVVYDMHEDYAARGGIEGSLLSALERWCLTWVNHVVLAEKGYVDRVYETTPRTYILNYALSEDLNRSCDTASRKERPGIRLLYTGVASRTRGLCTMLKTVEILKSSNISAHINISGVCNIPSDRRWAEAFIAKNSLEHNVVLNGWREYLPIQEMTSSYLCSDIGMCLMQPHSNYMKSIPTKFYEYLSYGLPILCSDFPLWRSFIEEHECGAVVPPGDAAAAASVVHDWMQNPAQYEACTRAACNAGTHFQWKIMGERLVNVYKTLVEQA